MRGSPASAPPRSRGEGGLGQHPLGRYDLHRDRRRTGHCVSETVLHGAVLPLPAALDAGRHRPKAETDFRGGMHADSFTVTGSGTCRTPNSTGCSSTAQSPWPGPRRAVRTRPRPQASSARHCERLPQGSMARHIRRTPRRELFLEQPMDARLERARSSSRLQRLGRLGQEPGQCRLWRLGVTRPADRPPSRNRATTTTAGSTSRLAGAAESVAFGRGGARPGRVLLEPQDEVGRNRRGRERQRGDPSSPPAGGGVAHTAPPADAPSRFSRPAR
jgi:hypothetical protein